jgi:hypothetical protein
MAFFVAGYFVQGLRVAYERQTQSLRAEDVNLRMSKPDLFDHQRYVLEVPAVLPRVELGLYVLGSFQVAGDGGLDVSALRVLQGLLAVFSPLVVLDLDLARP